MKYRDLIHFKPITEVIRFGDLRDERKRQQDKDFPGNRLRIRNGRLRFHSYRGVFFFRSVSSRDGVFIDFGHE